MAKKKKVKEKPEGLPALFLERLKMIIPEAHWPLIEESFHRKAFISFRLQKEGINPLEVISKLKALNIHATSVDWMPEAFVIPEAELKLLQETEYYLQGQIYVQNLSSMIVPMILNPMPGERILDMTAAPGSKSTQIAKMLHGEGHLYANEKIRNRFFKLKANLESQGYQNVTVSMQTGEIYGRFHPHFFDRVLLDAPCSSEGRFLADNPKTYLYWKPLKIKEMVSKQRNLIKSAIKTLRPGGDNGLFNLYLCS
jgi:16S rRNA C967 or C1407 C5-methylase (RsmB/RsmF family)